MAKVPAGNSDRDIILNDLKSVSDHKLSVRRSRLMGWLSAWSSAQWLEWFGVITAIVYSLLVASNTGLEFIGFTLLLVSSFSIGLWAYRGGHRGMLLLQFFYATAGVIGMLRRF